MAFDVIKMDYPTAEEMIKIFQQGGEQLQDTMQVVQKIASQLEDGALLGDGGKAFVDAIRNPLSSSLTKLTDKFQELSQDVQSAMTSLKEADSSSKGMF